MKNDHLERLKKRLKSIDDCKTVEELSWNIWSKNFEKASGSKAEDRKWFNERCLEYFNSYNFSVKQISEDIYQPFLDESDDYLFQNIRFHLEQKLIQLKKEYNENNQDKFQQGSILPR